MLTVIIIGLGFIWWAICLGVARLIPGAAGATTATAVFLALWPRAAGSNFWVGVPRPGYAARDGWPVFF